MFPSLSRPHPFHSKKKSINIGWTMCNQGWPQAGPCYGMILQTIGHKLGWALVSYRTMPMCPWTSTSLSG